MQALLYSLNYLERDVLTLILQHNGLEAYPVNHLEDAVQNWPEHPLDLALIAFSHDFPCSLELIKNLRMHTVVPIITIVDTIPEEDQASFLDAGVDLVLTRPFSVVLLNAQIRMLLRRSANVPFFSLPSLTQGPVQLDPAMRTVQVDQGEPVHLTQLEFRLLYTLMTHAEKVIPSEEIVDYVWGYEGESNKELVRGLVQRLRTKLEPDSQKPSFLFTEPGVGYYFSTRKS